MANFNGGQEVQIKSGSPIMTVNRKLNDGSLECVWFNREAWKVEKVILEQDALKLAQRVTPSPINEDLYDDSADFEELDKLIKKGPILPKKIS